MTNKEIDLIILLTNSYEKYDLDIKFIIDMIDLIDSNHKLTFGKNILKYNDLEDGVKSENTNLEQILTRFKYVDYEELKEDNGVYQYEDKRIDYVYSHSKDIIEAIMKNLAAWQFEEE